MTKAVYWLISRLGRFAALPILPLAAGACYVWLSLLDSHPFWTLGLGVAIIPLTTACVALGFGVLLAPSGALPSDQISRHDAPRLWALWDEIDPGARRRRRIIAIDDHLNASMSERRGPLAVRRTEILTLGLPLLMILDEAAVRAVIAHEAGHARLSHASGLANVADFVGAFDMLFHYADPDNTVTGAVAYAALYGGMRRLKWRQRAVSRRHEFEADAFAGPLRADMARALTLLAAANHSVHELVDRPLDRELLESASLPPSPLARTFARLSEIHRRGDAATALLPQPALSDEQAADEALYGSTHPSFADRLKSLGFDAAPDVNVVAESASATLLLAETSARLLDLFDARWRRDMERAR